LPGLPDQDEDLTRKVIDHHEDLANIRESERLAREAVESAKKRPPPPVAPVEIEKSPVKPTAPAVSAAQRAVTVARTPPKPAPAVRIEVASAISDEEMAELIEFVSVVAMIDEE